MSINEHNSKIEIVCNIFPADFKFNRPIPNVTFFRVSGTIPEKQRFKLVGTAVYWLERYEDVAFAMYFPSPRDNFIIGFLGRKPKKEEYIFDDLRITYEGEKSLPPTNAGKRALIELIYEIQRRNLSSKKYWKHGRNTFLPINWIKVDKFNVFRGPWFHYYFLSNGQLILVLDTVSHYISSEPFLNEIRRRGTDMKWFGEEIETVRKEFDEKRRKSRGIWFYYILENKNVVIDGFDPTPISEKRMEKIIDGEPWRGSIADFLKRNYSWNRRVRRLDTSQPCVCSGKYSYAPQMLHRHVKLSEVPTQIKNEMTHLIDTRSRKEDRNRHLPAQKRWRFIQKELENFKYVDLGLGQRVIKFSKPIKISLKEKENHFHKPRLLVQKDKGPVEPRQLPYALRRGVYKPPNIDEILLYSVDDELRGPFWGSVNNYFEQNLGWIPPENPMPLETSEREIVNYLEKRKSQGTLPKAACLAIIEDDGEQRKMLKNTLGKYGIPVQCVRHSTAKTTVDYNTISYLEGICAGLFAKSGGIPWLLYDELNYDCYVAVDVGREKAEYWAMGVVQDKRGTFEVIEGELMRGEDLNEASLERCVAKALEMEGISPERKKLKHLILLRDGDVKETELTIFKKVTEKTEIQNCAVAWIKKSVPHRIFRRASDTLLKPQSGDYVQLDENSIMICCAGVDEYEHGMPKPKVVELTVIKGDIDITKIAQDIFYMSYLNWGSPSHSYSSPAPLRLAHKLASQLSRGLRPSGQPF